MASISATGRYVAFASRASDLVREDGNGAEDVFVRDLRTSRTELASRHSGGGSGARTIYPSISADGPILAFHSDAPDVVPHDTTATGDTFVRDLVRRVTVIKSRASGTMAEGNGYSGGPSI